MDGIMLCGFLYLCGYDSVRNLIHTVATTNRGAARDFGAHEKNVTLSSKFILFFYSYNLMFS